MLGSLFGKILGYFCPFAPLVQKTLQNQNVLRICPISPIEFEFSNEKKWEETALTFYICPPNDFAIFPCIGKQSEPAKFGDSGWIWLRRSSIGFSACLPALLFKFYSSASELIKFKMLEAFSNFNETSDLTTEQSNSSSNCVQG